MGKSRIVSAALAAALLVAASPVSAQEAWEHRETDDRCEARTEYTDGTRVTVTAAKDFRSGDMSFWNRRWSSIVPRRRYPIRLEFEGGLSFDLSGSGMIVEATGDYAANHGIFVPIADMIVIAALARAPRVAVWNGDDLVGRYSLAGSRAAILEIAECTGRLSQRVVADPFAE